MGLNFKLTLDVQIFICIKYTERTSSNHIMLYCLYKPVSCGNLRPQSSGEHSKLIVITDEQNRSWSSRPQSGTFTFSTFLRRDNLMCGQNVPISCRWLSEARWGFLRMKNFSLTHSLHVFVTGLNGWPRSRIFHFTFHVEPLALHSQM